MAKHSNADLVARLEELTTRQDEALALDEGAFNAWCDKVASMDVDPILGLVQRLQAMSFASAGFGIDHRFVSLTRAEEMVVDQLDRVELIERLLAKSLTQHQCEYWLSRRPKEVPTVNGYPVWLAATLTDVVDLGRP